MKVTIPYHLSASPTTEAKVSIYKIPPAKRFILTKIEVAFPVGTYGELEIALYRGHMRLWPEERNVTGDDVHYVKELRWEFDSGSEILLYYKNVNTTQVRDAFIVLEGELA